MNIRPTGKRVVCPVLQFGAMRAARGARSIAEGWYASKTVDSPTHGRVTIVAAVLKGTLLMRAHVRGRWLRMRYKDYRPTTNHRPER